jgi:hypothetical protein
MERSVVKNLFSTLYPEILRFAQDDKEIEIDKFSHTLLGKDGSFRLSA